MNLSNSELTNQKSQLNKEIKIVRRGNLMNETKTKTICTDSVQCTHVHGILIKKSITNMKKAATFSNNK